MIAMSRAPLRISFAGGGTDAEPFCTMKGGCVVSATIARYVWVRMDSDGVGYSAYPPDAEYGNTAFVEKLVSHFKPVSLDVRVDAPRRSGLGGSGAFGVAITGCLNALNEKLTLHQIAELAYEVENEKIAGGRQDQFASAYGGINRIEFSDRVEVSRLKLKPETILSLEMSTFLVFTHPRYAGNVMEDEVRRVKENTGETIEALLTQKALANLTSLVLQMGDLVTFGKLLDEAWNTKKKQTPMATTELVEELYRRVKKAGALGAKCCGAGGGGYFAVFAPGKETKVCEAILSLGLTPEPVVLDWQGLKVWK